MTETVGTILELKNSPTSGSYLVTEKGKDGLFVWTDGDYSWHCGVDPKEGVYVRSNTVSQTQGAFVRVLGHLNGVLDTWFGVKRVSLGANSGPDNREAFQAALNFCRDDSRDLLLTRGVAFVSEDPASPWCLKNQGVCMIGLPGKATFSVIATSIDVPPNCDIIHVEVGVNQYQDFLKFENFMISPNWTGQKRGGKALAFYSPLATNYGKLKVSRIYCGPGNDYSLFFENSIPVNAQGNPSNAIIEDNSFHEGVWLNGVGDNISIRDNFIISSEGSGRHGIYIYQVDYNGVVASFACIERNAMNADGCAILMDRGRNPRISNNNIEHSHGSSGPSSSIIHLRGSGGVISKPVIDGNAIGVFGSSTARVGINTGVSFAATVIDNNIISNTTRSSAIAIGGPQGVVDRNKVSPNWTTPINNGDGTNLIGRTVISNL